MNNLNELNLTDLNQNELQETQGGSFGYDVGYWIRYAIYHGPGTGPLQWAAWEIQEAGLEAMK